MDGDWGPRKGGWIWVGSASSMEACGRLAAGQAVAVGISRYVYAIGRSEQAQGFDALMVSWDGPLNSCQKGNLFFSIDIISCRKSTVFLFYSFDLTFSHSEGLSRFAGPS